MSIDNPTDAEAKLKKGKNDNPLQFPSDLKSEEFTGSRYLVHFKIRPHSEGRSSSSSQSIKNPGPDDPKKVESNSKIHTATFGSRKDVYLYMPENITETFTHDWDSVELGSIKRLLDLTTMSLTGRGTDALKQVGEQAKRMVTGAIEGASPFNATQLRERNLGLVINPNIEMLYKNSQIKQHSFQFKFIPKNDREAVVARQIVELFKYHSASSFMASGDTASVLKYPDIFEIRFLYGGDTDEAAKKSWLYHIEPCALTSIEVDYTGAGQFANHHDGSLVQINMTLQFTELMIQTKERIFDNVPNEEIKKVLL